MKSQILRKNRILLIFIILLVSFSLVGVALAAAGQAGKAIADSVTPPQTQVGGNSELSIPPSPMQAAFELPVVQSLPDPLMEQMRQQVMTANQAQSKPARHLHPYITDADVGLTAPSKAPLGIDRGYIPQGIVVDTYLNYIYGYSTPYVLVTITRADGAYGTAEADDVGFFWTSLYDGSYGGTPVDIGPGDVLEINGTPITVGQDPTGILLETLEGNISGETAGTVVTTTVGLYGQPSTAYGIYTTVTDDNGDFSITFTQDVGPENFAVVDYRVDGVYQRTYLFPDRVALVQQHGMISGYAERGSVITATVKKFDDYNGEPRWGPFTTTVDSAFGWFTFYGVTLDYEQNNGDKVVVEFPGGPCEMEYVYASHFTFSGNDTVSGNLSHGERDLRLSFLEWDEIEGDYIYREITTTSELNGDFTATFDEGVIKPDTRVDVVASDGGSGSYMMTGQPYVEIIKDYATGLNCVWGRVDKPNANMILELERDGYIYPRDPSRPIISDPGNMAGGDYCFNVWYDFGNGLERMEFLPGDILRLSTDTWSGAVTFLEIHVSGWAPDNEVDVGIINGPLGGDVVVRAFQSDYDFFRQGTVSEARCDIIGDVCTMRFDSFDVRAGVFMQVYYFDSVTSFAIQLQDQYHYFRTIGNSAVQGNATPTEAITLTLYEPFNPEPVYISTNDLDPDPVTFYFDFGDCDQFPGCPNPPLQPGYTVEVQYQWHYTGDWQLTYQDVMVDGDPALDLISSSSPDGLVELSAGFEEESFDQMAPTWNSQAVINTTFFGYDLGWGDSVNMTYKDPVGNYLWTSKLMGEIRRVEFWIQPNNQVWLWGTAQPSSEVVIQTSRGDTLYGYTEAINGNFGTDHSTLLLPGDTITVTAGEGIYPVSIDIPDVRSNSDSATNTVNGQTGFPEQTVVEIYAWWSGEMFTATTGLDGEFTKILSDIPPQGRGHIRYIKEFGETNVDAIFHRPFFDLEPFITTNYAHNWVESQYDVGYTVAITVTDESGDLKATAHGETSIIPWWGEGEPGFSTGYNVFWDGLTPDLQPFDHIYLDIGGRTADLRVGEITGELNVATDTLVGTLNASWLTFPVDGDCGVWIENGQGVGFTTDELGNFTCDFAGVEDLMPGMDIGVGYNDQENGRVYNVFNKPAPHLWINVEHQGEPAQGNNYAFLVHYNNDGWATANNVVITQTFEGMTYLSDTSGFPHMGTGAMGDPVTWQLGDLPVNRYTDSTFFVFVSIDDPTAVSTAVNITTIPVDYYQDEGSKHSESGLLMVVENDSDLNIHKWAWTWAPAPGQEFVYAVNVCNNGMASSSEVLITDTLPLATTLVDWWGQYPGWEEVSSAAHELVVKRPSISGNGGCSEVYINVLLDAQVQPDEELINLAHVWASSDVNPTNNEASMNHPVGSPDYNLHLSTNWVQGQFVPGGEVSFELNYSNWGNMPIPGTVITTTLPQGTEFIMAYTWDWSGWHLITDTIVGDGYLRWELGDFKNGYSSGLGVHLKIADDTPTGTSLVVENRIMGEATEYRYDDNILVYTELVNPDGPNLRVDKHTNWWWNDWGDGSVHTQTLNYELRILNIGTQFIDNPIVVDTFPISTTFNAWWINHGPFSSTVDVIDHQVIFYLDKLDPGETASAAISVYLAPADVGVQGLEFLNQVEISDFEDVTPQDNLDLVTSYTGPDVFVRKWLKEGELRAGEMITYTVEFGNMNRWPWNGDNGYGSHITETLPAGLTFVKAIGYWDPGSTWDPESINGQEVVWEWGTMWAEQTWTFDLVVQIDEDVPLGTELLNHIEAWSDNPTDIEVNPANNSFEYTLSTIIYKFMLPITQRTP